MSKRTARIELVPARMTPTHGGSSPRKGGSTLYPLAKASQPHYLRLVAGNGECVATSELYSTRSNARRASHAWVAAFRDVLATPTTERVHEVTR